MKPEKQNLGLQLIFLGVLALFPALVIGWGIPGIITALQFFSAPPTLPAANDFTMPSITDLMSSNTIYACPPAMTLKMTTDTRPNFNRTGTVTNVYYSCEGANGAQAKPQEIKNVSAPTISPFQTPKVFWNSPLAQLMGWLAFPMGVWLVLLYAFRPGARLQLSERDSVPAGWGILPYSALVVIPLVAFVALFALNPLDANTPQIIGTSNLRTSEVYTLAMQAAQNEPTVTEALGAPITSTGNILGVANGQGNKGDADWVIPISGSRASGKIYVSATKVGTKWRFYWLAFQLNGSEDATILKPPAP